MIKDPVVLQEIQDAWEFVRHTRNVIVGNCNVATLAVGFNQSGMRDMGFNLLLASAFSVLEEVLLAIRDQGEFACGSSRLQALMQQSLSVLPWRDFALVDAGRIGRNASIHERAYLPHARCRDYIAAIESELVSWGVLQEETPQLWHW